MIFTGIIFVLEFYVYQAFKTVVTNPYGRIAYIAINILIYLFLVYNLLNFRREDRDHHRVQFVATLFLAFLLPKILIAPFLLIDDFVRLIGWTGSYFSDAETVFPGRRKFLSVVGLASAGILSALFLDGVIFGKYRHRVRKVKLKINNLPESFKGYKIIQISDLHAGSFFNTDKLKPAFELINEQKPDLILFTGDMVNNIAEEMRPFIPLLGSLQAKDGKFSVLGNHDYGEYVGWKSQKDKQQNIPNLIAHQNAAGFKVMRNQNSVIEKNGERIYILGVENWGLKPFPQYGDIDKALKGVPQEAVKILMSHDPTHFDEIVKHHPANIALTLSGHTHGMQFGLDLKNVRWSPVKFRYKKWADLYESAGKYLYVNRGFGVIGYPGRVGILPEITLFELS